MADFLFRDWEKSAYSEAVRLSGTANSTGALAMIAALHTFSTTPFFAAISPFLKSGAISFAIGIVLFAALHASRVLLRFCLFVKAETKVKPNDALPQGHLETVLWSVQGLSGVGSGVCFFLGMWFAFKALLIL
jgi:hypothetical protein